METPHIFIGIILLFVLFTSIWVLKIAIFGSGKSPLQKARDEYLMKKYTGQLKDSDDEE